MPALIIIGIVLYVDRVLRQEVIFDSSALTCTVFAVHILNLCRSSIAHIDSSTPTSLANSTSLMPAAAAVSNVVVVFSLDNAQASAAEASTMRFQHHLATAAYCLVSILLLMDMDVASYAWPSSSSRLLHKLYNNPNGSSGSRSACLDVDEEYKTKRDALMQVSTIVLHCILVGGMMQIAVGGQQSFMLPWKIMLRSYLFALLSIFWTYAVGIHHASQQTRTYPYFYNPVLQKKYVQPFTPCQLRFLVLLLIDGWMLAATGTCMVAITLRHISHLASTISGSSSHHSNTAADMPAAVLSEITVSCASAIQQAHSSASSSAHVSLPQQGLQQVRHSMEQQQLNTNTNTNDVAVMFRLAQQQQRTSATGTASATGTSSFHGSEGM